jgi:hypothetical protein
MKEIKVCSNKGPGFAKLKWNHLKICFSRTTWPILSRLGTNHLCGDIQVCTNEGNCPSPRGDNCKTVKIH